eukprot:TRINITY_DN46095_c0_g1_i1.p1 TRINITY_DN46095_c0_g1~~TRINITY_DN46095_c0_g1_i1.p1  ORF type:complete len:524 (+),score=235.65 TRINITY_DN46095_c0_g1_i1:40-1572(+)
MKKPLCLLFLLLAATLIGAAADATVLAAGFRNVSWDTVAEHQPLRVEGTIPAWLHGTLYRNGPARTMVPLNESHWFDGLAMVHAFEFSGGSVAFSRRFIASSAYNDSKPSDPCDALFDSMRHQAHKRPAAAAAAAAATAASDPSPPISPNTLVCLRKVDGQLLTNTGFSTSNAIDPRTLATTAAPFVYDDKMQPGPAPSHAHTDLNGTVVHFIASFNSSAPGYNVYTIKPGTRTRIPLGLVPGNPILKMPFYQHSFGLTENYVVLAEQPCTYARDMEWKNFKWIPIFNTTWKVMSRATGKVVAEFYSDPFFTFHFINSYEKDDSIVVDLIGYDDNKVIDLLYLKNIVYTPKALIAASLKGGVMRFVLPMETPGARVKVHMVTKEPLVAELPTIHYEKLNTRPYEFMYAMAVADPTSGIFFDTVAKVNMNTGTVTKFNPCPDQPNTCFTGEPLFVPSPNPVSEDDGVLVDVVLNVTDHTSFVVVIDARTMTSVARASAETAIPLGFHGRFY